MHAPCRARLLAGFLALLPIASPAEPLQGPLGGQTPLAFEQLASWLDALPAALPCQNRYHDPHEVPQRLLELQGALFGLENELPVTGFWLKQASDDPGALALTYASADDRLAAIHAKLLDLVELTERTGCPAPQLAATTLGEVLALQRQTLARRASPTPSDLAQGIRQAQALETQLHRLGEKFSGVLDIAFGVGHTADSPP